MTSKSSAKRTKPAITRCYSLDVEHHELIGAFVRRWACSRSEALRSFIDDHVAAKGPPKAPPRRKARSRRRFETLEERKTASFVLDAGYVEIIAGYAREWGVTQSAAVRSIIELQAT